MSLHVQDAPGVHRQTAKAQSYTFSCAGACSRDAPCSIWRSDRARPEISGKSNIVFYRTQYPRREFSTHRLSIRDNRTTQGNEVVNLPASDNTRLLIAHIAFNRDLLINCTSGLNDRCDGIFRAAVGQSVKDITYRKIEKRNRPRQTKSYLLSWLKQNDIDKKLILNN